MPPRWQWMPLLPVVLVACAPSGGRELRLGTFNVRNLAASDPPAKRRGVAEILGRVAADVVLLEEVGGAAALEGLAAEPAVAERYSYRIRFDGNDQRGFGLGLLSSLRPAGAMSHRDDWFDGYRYTRDCLEVHFDLGRGRLVLLGVHLRAQLADDPEHRLAEAQQTRRIASRLMGEDPELWLVVLGDFNDVPGSPPLEALGGPEPPLASVVSTLPIAERWTTGEGQLFDDLLVNPRLGAALRPDSVSVLHDPELDAELADVSDHAPVAASFRVGEEG
jgi:endonuclease/exonuclease/phosphatase family metal-dependent hydrolase